MEKKYIDITKLKYYNDKGEKKYNIDKIVSYLNNREGKGLIRDICILLAEERVILINIARFIRRYITNPRQRKNDQFY
jgi:hypothetical protein